MITIPMRPNQANTTNEPAQMAPTANKRVNKQFEKGPLGTSAVISDNMNKANVDEPQYKV